MFTQPSATNPTENNRPTEWKPCANPMKNNRPIGFQATALACLCPIEAPSGETVSLSKRACRPNARVEDLIQGRQLFLVTADGTQLVLEPSDAGLCLSPADDLDGIDPEVVADSRREVLVSEGDYQNLYDNYSYADRHNRDTSEWEAKLDAAILPHVAEYWSRWGLAGGPFFRTPEAPREKHLSYHVRRCYIRPMLNLPTVPETVDRLARNPCLRFVELADSLM